MTDKIEKLTKRLHSTKLKKNYPRVKRENTELSPEYLSTDQSLYYPPKEDGNVYAAAKEPPLDGFELAFEMRLEREIHRHNNLLTYRMLRLLYNAPDILGAYVNINSEKLTIHSVAPMDWGFTLQILPNLLAEIRTVHAGTSDRLRFWIDRLSKTRENKAPYIEKMMRFVTVFTESLEKNRHLFNEEVDVTDFATIVQKVIRNIFSEKYRAGELLLKLAQKHDLPLEINEELRFTESLEVATVGSVYLSSALQFIIALEALINAVLTLRLKEEFKAEQYERIVIRADLDLRLTMTHVFCEGFRRQVLAPKIDLWRRLLKLRKFRNEIIHGNVTEDNYIHVLQEDGYLFWYAPATNYRGRKAEAKAIRSYPTHTPHT